MTDILNQIPSGILSGFFLVVAILISGSFNAKLRLGSLFSFGCFFSTTGIALANENLPNLVTVNNLLYAHPELIGPAAFSLVIVLAKLVLVIRSKYEENQRELITNSFDKIIESYPRYNKTKVLSDKIDKISQQYVTNPVLVMESYEKASLDTQVNFCRVLCRNAQNTPEFSAFLKALVTYIRTHRMIPFLANYDSLAWLQACVTCYLENEASRGDLDSLFKDAKETDGIVFQHALFNYQKIFPDKKDIVKKLASLFFMVICFGTLLMTLCPSNAMASTPPL